jgi:hypothetical protein
MDIKEIISFLNSDNNINAKLNALNKLCNSAEEQDLPILFEAIQSKTMGFDVREWLAEPIIKLAGIQSLPILLKALRINFEEGHDNDSLQGILSGFAENNSKEVRIELAKLKINASEKEREDIEWLLEFCNK